MMKHLSLLCAALLATPGFAADLRQAKFTQVIKDVTVIAAGSKTTAKAKLNDQFINPDIVQTGPDSLAELVADDKTVTRIGANTVFAFSAKGREINLEQGSVLFHSPKGKGGGTIKTKAASASVLGTTIVVTATAGGGFKAIVLEGRGQITLPNGNFRILTAGQVTFVLPGSQRFGPQLNINLSKLVESSRLVQGFENDLPSKPVILAAIERQLVLLRTGIADDTGILVGNQATENTLATVLEQAVENREDRLTIAKATDVVIRTDDLRDHPNHVFLDPIPFDLPALGVLNFSGFVGKSITVAATVTQLDFTPFLNQTDFTIAAAGTLDLQTAVLQLSAVLPAMGTPALQKVTLAGKAGLTIVPGASISAFHIGDLQLVTDGAMSLDSVTLNNSSGKVRLNAAQALNLTGGSIQSTPSMTLESANLNITGGAQFQATTVNMAASRDATLTSAVIRGFTTLNLNAVRNLSVASGSFTGVSGSPGIAANLSAGEILTVNGTSIGNVANISLSARTVNLSNIDFANGSTVRLYSQTGLLADNPNTGAQSVPGHVNFIINVNYNGSPAQTFVGNVANNITIGVRP